MISGRVSQSSYKLTLTRMQACTHHMAQVLKEQKTTPMLPAPGTEPCTVAQHLSGSARGGSADQVQVATLLIGDDKPPPNRLFQLSKTGELRVALAAKQGC